MKFTLAQIAGLLDVQVGDEFDCEVTGLSIDSRQTVPGDLFCAIEGHNVDGHSFVQDAIEKGAVAAMVLRRQPVEIPQVVVPSIEDALAKIAGAIRDQFRHPVIGVTGSVGKTTVKEFIAAALGDCDTLKTLGNLNTEFGVPMSWMNLDSRHRFAVIEMAMRGRQQIRHLCEISKPTIGVITSIGTAHIGELGSREGILKAKSELLESLPEHGRAIIPTDDGFVDEMRQKCRCLVETFGFHESSDWRVLSWEADLPRYTTQVVIERKQEEFSAAVPGLGAGSARNAAAALAAATHAGVDTAVAASRIRDAKIPFGRMQFETRHGVTLLVDVYNSSPESCKEALEILSRVGSGRRRVAILGDMLELGAFSESLHREVGEFAATLSLTDLAVLGEEAEWILNAALLAGYRGRVQRLRSIEDARLLLSELSEGDVALLKASRSVELERALESQGARLD